MDMDFFHDYCLQKPGAEACFPFNEEILVFKVGGKMFALANIVTFTSINVKCDPTRAIVLRESYPSIIPGWHMNKRHWNTLCLEEGLSDQEVCAEIDHSYELVFKNLSKKQQATILAITL